MKNTDRALMRSLSDQTLYHRYAIRVRGCVESRIVAQWEGMTLLRIGAETILEGPVADNAALEQLFRHLGRCGLTVVGVHCLGAVKEVARDTGGGTSAGVQVNRPGCIA